MAISKTLGLAELTKVYIYVLLTLVFLTFAMNPIFKSIEELSINSARLQAQELAAVINTIKTADADSVRYSMNLPAPPCRVEFNSIQVSVVKILNNKEFPYEADIIQTPVPVTPISVDCETTRSIIIEKSGSTINIRSS